MKTFLALILASLVAHAQTTVFSWTGTTPTDHLGTAVAGPGDLNGDGVPDIVTGATSLDSQNPTAGSVIARSGADGSILWQLNGVVSYERFGTDIKSAGDITGDWINDLVVAAPGLRGVVLVSGADGGVIRSMADPSDQVDGGGDYNGDGVPDQLACWKGPQSTFTGGVKIYSGTDGSVLLSVNPGDYGLNGNGSPDMRAAFLKDIDGDLHDDVLVTRQISGIAVRTRGPNGVGGGAVVAPGLWGQGISDIGSVTADNHDDVAVAWLLFATPFHYYFRVYNSVTGEVVWEREAVPVNGGLVVFGSKTSRLPDLDGDGKPEIVANSSVYPGGPTTPTSTGVTIVSGATGIPLTSVFTPVPLTGGGGSIATIGDVTGDGMPEFAFGNSANGGYLAVVSPVALTAGSILDLGGGCGAFPTVLAANTPVIGTTFALDISGGLPLASASVVVDLASNVATPLGSCTIHLDLAHFPQWGQVPVTLDAAGAASFNYQIPTMPALGGQPFTTQAVVLGTSSALGVDLSNGLRGTIGY